MNNRYKKIEELLKNKGNLTVREMAFELNVSEATIRRDLINMEEKNLIERIWGGAKVFTANSDDITGSPYIDSNSEYSMRFYKNVEIKRNIGRYAASLIKNGMWVFIDSGSTVSYLCEYIETKDITVITNNINILQSLASKGITTYLTCGYINFSSASIVSNEASNDLSKFNYDIAFLGCGGIDEKFGFTSKDNADYLIKKTVVEKAHKVYVLADETKFDRRNPFTYASFNEATLISNKECAYIKDNIIVK